MTIKHYVFISYSRKDSPFATKLADSLRAAGIEAWTDVENIPAGANWQKEIEKGLQNAAVLVYVSSRNSKSSQWMLAELQAVLGKKTPVIPVIIDDEGIQNLPNSLHQIQWVDFRADFDFAFSKLLGGVDFLQQPEPLKRPELKSKGYVFVSYADEDQNFVVELRTFLSKRGYAYWDFKESHRNYDVDYSLELENVIQEAATTLCVISRNWKGSKVTMQEFHFSREVGTPVFLLKVTDPGPTLALSGLTFIDFTQSRDEGFERLDRELKRKRL